MNDADLAKIAFGSVVYRVYSPAQYGKVLEIDPAYEHHPGYPTTRFWVRWKDGTESWVTHYEVRSLDSLIEDHERKLATHRAAQEKARAL